LSIVEIGEFAGRAERRQSMHARLDEIVAEARQHIRADLPARINRRDQIGKDAVEIGHGAQLLPNARQRRNPAKIPPAE